LFSSPARADLILSGPVQLTGTGFGNVNTILTMQATGQKMGGLESGCVGVSTSGGGTLNATVRAGFTDVCRGTNVGGDEKQPAAFPHNQTFLVSDAASLAIIFNSDQPQNNNGSISLNNLVLTMFNASGQSGFSSGNFASAVNFANTSFESGIGKSGWEFVLTPAQAAEAQAAINSGFDYLGLSATANDAKGGPETFFLTTLVSPVPEPATMTLLGSGLLGLAGLLRRGKALR
jgi:hypothetical protein